MKRFKTLLSILTIALSMQMSYGQEYIDYQVRISKLHAHVSNESFSDENLVWKISHRMGASTPSGGHLDYIKTYSNTNEYSSGLDYNISDATIWTGKCLDNADNLYVYVEGWEDDSNNTTFGSGDDDYRSNTNTDANISSNTRATWSNYNSGYAYAGSVGATNGDYRAYLTTYWNWSLPVNPAFSLGDVTPTGFTISFGSTNNYRITSWEYDVSTSSDFSNIVSSNTDITSDAVVTGLDSEMAYYVRIRGRNERGVGSYTSTQTIEIPRYIYIDQAAQGSNDGTSWANAFVSLQEAIDSAVSSDQMWVAKGTYYPSVEVGGVGERFKTFQMKDGVAMYGGFSGVEGLASERSDFGLGDVNETILSGDVGVAGDSSDNSYHVFNLPDSLGLTTSSVLNGFTITAGNADLASGYNNYGGAIYNIDNSISISNCCFVNNSSDKWAGAIYMQNSSSTIENCLFLSNTSLAGGAYMETNSAVSLSNCTFSNNTGIISGGALCSSGSTSTLSNSILWNNISPLSPEIYSPASQITSTNCNIKSSGGSAAWGEKLGVDGGSNIDVDPKFVGTIQNALHPYSLPANSPCVDAGSITGVTENDDIRGDGFSRTQGGTVDMGAYEYTLGSDSLGQIIMVSASNISNGSYWDEAYTSLQTALDLALSGDEIWVAKGTYKPSLDTNKVVPSSTYKTTFQMIDGVEIYGGFSGSEDAVALRTDFREGGANETILSGDVGFSNEQHDNCHHIFTHPHGYTLTETAVLDGFTLCNGYSDGGNEGAAMYNYNVSPTIRNCVFHSNETFEYGGGALYFYLGSSSIENCIFHDNITTEMDNEGGAIYIDDGSLLISNSLFYNNGASHGGALYTEGTSSTNLLNCTFVSNQAGIEGGAVKNGDAVSNLVARNCVFWDNFAWSGANKQIYNYGTASYFNSDIEGSGGSASWLSSDLGVDSGNNIDADPLFASPHTDDYRIVSMSPCVDAGDTLFSTALYDVRGVTYHRALDENNATGGLIDIGAYEYQIGLDPIALGHVYVDSAATGSDNGTSWDNAYNSFQDALDDVRPTQQMWVARGTYKPSQEIDGTLDSIREYTFQMVNGIEIYGGFAGSETAISQRVDFDYGELNETILSGDIGVAGDSSDNCYHVFYHPASHALDTTSILDGFTITKGYADGDDSDATIGAGMFNSGLNGPDCSPKLFNCNFIDNYAESRGGALYNFFSATPLLENCNFIDNSSKDYYGSAIYNSNLTLDMKLDSCEIRSNSSESGGTVYNNSSPDGISMLFLDCIFMGNTTWGSGAAIYTDNVTIEIEGCVFEDNHVQGNTMPGGAIYSGDTLSITNSTFTNNSSTLWGGAIYQYDYKDLNVRNSKFTSNSSIIAGAIYFSSHTPGSIDSCSFVSNDGSEKGGALYIYGSSPSISNSTFLNNTSKYGGAMYNIANGAAAPASPYIANCLFSNNATTNVGGAIFNREENDSPTFVNTTITGNSTTSTYGGAIYNYSLNSPTYKNCIIWGNTSNDDYANIYSGVGATATFYNSNIEGSFVDDEWNTAFGVDSGGNIDADPIFAGPDDYRLTSLSPCIDAGDDDANLETYDLNGLPRIQGVRIDMGAYEGGPILPVLAFVDTESSALESVSSADLKIIIDTTSLYDITVNYTVSGTAVGGGEDYTLADGIATILAGDTAVFITIADIVSDFTEESNESVIVTLSGSAGATLGEHTVHQYTIINDDFPTALEAKLATQVKVYPNPFENEINIEGLEGKTTTVRLTDISGRYILSKSINGNESITLDHLTKGIYLLLIENESDEKQMIKIIKE